MKLNLKNLIRECLQEIELDEDYPVSFDMETFKSLGSHAGRNRYAAEHLQKLAQGSSRIVYKIDDEKVLKLAKNDKGIAQNSTEITWGNDSYFGSVLARIFDYDDRDLWVEMEFARKITKSEFKKLTGFDIYDVGMYLKIADERNRGRRPGFSMDPELYAKIGEDEFVTQIFDFSQSAKIEVGDFGQASSYGIVKRDGHEMLVITDYGLTKDVYLTHYEKPRQMARQRAGMYEGESASSNYSLKDWPEGKYKGSIKGYDVYSDEIDSGFKATTGYRNMVPIPCTIYVKDGHALAFSKGGILFSDKEIESEWKNKFGGGAVGMKKDPRFNEYLN
jgi:hypothetical protein